MFQDSQVKVEQIMDQKDVVDERQQNIKDIADMMSKVNQISKEMNQLIHKQDENLDSIHKKQDKIHKNAKGTVNDLVEADNLTKKKLKKIAIWAGAIILLGICVVGLVYIIKGTDKKSDGGDTDKQVLGALVANLQDVGKSGYGWLDHPNVDQIHVWYRRHPEKGVVRDVVISSVI
jgi:hypothetical protein